MSLWKVYQDQLKYKNNIDTHYWDLNTQIIEQDRYRDCFNTFFACSACGLKCIKGIEHDNIFVVVKFQDAKLTCSQILMRDVLK